MTARRDELAAAAGAFEQNIDHRDRELVDGKQETWTNQSSET